MPYQIKVSVYCPDKMPRRKTPGTYTVAVAVRSIERVDPQVIRSLDLRNPCAIRSDYSLLTFLFIDEGLAFFLSNNPGLPLGRSERHAATTKRRRFQHPSDLSSLECAPKGWEAHSTIFEILSPDWPTRTYCMSVSLDIVPPGRLMVVEVEGASPSSSP